MAIVRTLTKVDRKAYDAALLAEAIRETVQRAKQVAVGLMIYAADYEDNLPANDGDINSKLGPYLKNNELLSGFTYTFGGGSLVDVERPAETEIGYIDGPGGRAAIYADGHAKWIPSKP